MTQPWWPGTPENPAGSPPAHAWQQPQQPPHGSPGATTSAQGHPAGATVPMPASPWAAPAVTTSGATAQLPEGRPVVERREAAGGPTSSGAMAPAPARTVPGLGLLVFLLVVAALGFAWFVASTWVTDWALGLDGCLDGGGAWECVVNDTSRRRVLLPVVAVLGALCLARGAGVERRQGRAIGFVHALLGLAVLALAWSTGAVL